MAKRWQRAIRESGITEVTDYRWRKAYRSLKGNQAKRPKELERENARLTKWVVDLSLEKAILQEAQIVIEH